MGVLIESIRRCCRICTDIIDMGFEFLEEKIYRNRYSRRRGEEPVSMAVAVEEAKQNAEEQYKRKECFGTGISTGFHDVDIMTGGLKPGEVTLIAGRPSMGKTALALSILEQASVKNEIPCALFSLEASKEQITQRMLCSIAKVNIHKVRTGFLSQSDWPKLVAAAEKLSKTPSFIDDTQALSSFELTRKVRNLKRKHDVQLIVVDYLQCTSGLELHWSNEHKFTVFPNLLAKLAKDLNIAVILLSQLPRGVEERSEHRPYLSDLMEYGEIVNIVDRVFLLYREEYYMPTEDNRGVTDIIIAKQRHGPVGVVNVKFIAEYSKFVDFVNYEDVGEREEV